VWLLECDNENNSGHICERFLGIIKIQHEIDNMVSKERIREEGLTTDDVMKREFAEPQDTVEWVPEWDDNPETRPGENVQITHDGEVLEWERDGFEVGLESWETTHWMAAVTIPERVGKYYPREVDLKCYPLPEHGYVDHVETVEYRATMANLVIQANFQPIWEVNNFIDQLLEDAKASEQREQEIGEKMATARENED